MAFVENFSSLIECVDALRSMDRSQDIIIDKRSSSLFLLYLYSPGIEDAMYCPMYEGLSVGIVLDYFDNR
jgi:hypothetical protein